MSLEPSGSRPPRLDQQAVLTTSGLTPLQIMEWIREAGYRAQPELGERMLRIETGLAGYLVNVWCHTVTALDTPCSSIQLAFQLRADPGIDAGVLRSFLNDYNMNWRYVTASLNAHGIITLALDFIVDQFTTTALFAQYFRIFDNLLQDFRLTMRRQFYPG
ncbi:MAG: hypothetical protein ACRYF1_09970 [Janthinobacterium lividum]